MAELKINDNNVTVQLSWWEKIGARRSHLTVPRRAIREIKVVDNAIDAVDIPLKGTGRIRIPGVFVAGTRAYTSQKVDEVCRENEFSVCRKNEPGLVIQLENISINRIVISTPDAQRYARELATAR